MYKIRVSNSIRRRCVEFTWKMRKMWRESIVTKGGGGYIWSWKVEISRTAHLESLLNVLPNFNSLINQEERYAWESLFSMSKRRKSLISPLLIDVKDWFLYMLYHVRFSIDRSKNEQFLLLELHSIPFPKFEHYWISTQCHSYSKISNSPPI